jgi:hypothetical protein
MRKLRSWRSKAKYFFKFYPFISVLNLLIFAPFEKNIEKIFKKCGAVFIKKLIHFIKIWFNFAQFYRISKFRVLLILQILNPKFSIIKLNIIVLVLAGKFPLDFAYLPKNFSPF